MPLDRPAGFGARDDIIGGEGVPSRLPPRAFWVMTMLSEAAAHAAELRTLLDDGALSAAGTIEIAPGIFESADVAVTQLLDALDHAEQAPTTDSELLRRLEAEIERLYRAVKAHL